MSGACQQLSTVSLMTQQGCRTRAAVKRRVFGATGVSRVVGAGCGGVLLGLAVCFVALEVWFVVQGGAERGIQPSSTMTWQATWTCKASWWAHFA